MVTSVTLVRTVALVIALTVCSARAQQPLQQQLRSIAAKVRGKVSGVYSLSGTQLDCNLDRLSHPPMRSVAKLPLVLAFLLYLVPWHSWIVSSPKGIVWGNGRDW